MHTNNKQGVVLIMVLSFLAVLLFIAGTVFFVLNFNVRQAGYSASAVAAFQAADAGADYVLSRLRADEISNVVTLKTANVSVNYSAPSGFDFDTVTNLTRLASGRSFSFRVTGHRNNANATVEVVLGRNPANLVGVFSDTPLDLGPGTLIKSYNSSMTTNPTVSTHEATVASNESVGGQATAVDGTIYLGENAAGTPATYSYEYTTPATVVHTENINPDPLGAGSGVLSNTFTYVSISNNNAAAVGATIAGSQISLLNDVTLTAGSYYVKDINLGNHRTLTINAAGGPVKLYLTGSSNTDPNSYIVVNPPLPANLQIFSKGTATLNFQPHNSFCGFIYAPFATVSIKPNGDFYGALWAHYLDIAPTGSMYVDTDFVALFDNGQPLTRLAWKQILD